MDRTFDEVFREAGRETNEEKEREAVEQMDTKNWVAMVKKGKGVYLHVYRNKRLVEVKRIS